MEIVYWLLVVPVVLMVTALLKGFVLSQTPLFRNTRFVTKEKRGYSKEALEFMQSIKMSKEMAEITIEKGKKSKHGEGFKFNYKGESDFSILIYTDALGHVLRVVV